MQSGGCDSGKPGMRATATSFAFTFFELFAAFGLWSFAKLLFFEFFVFFLSQFGSLNRMQKYLLVIILNKL